MTIELCASGENSPLPDGLYFNINFDHMCKIARYLLGYTVRTCVTGGGGCMRLQQLAKRKQALNSKCVTNNECICMHHNTWKKY